MAGFASQITQTVPVGTDGQTAVIRKLGWKALDHARQVVQQRGLEMMKTIGWSEIQKSVAAQGGEAAVKAQADADPFLQHDPMVLLERGVVSWTLSEKPAAKELEDLDEATAMALARAVYELSRPRTDAETKNA